MLDEVPVVKNLKWKDVYEHGPEEAIRRILEYIGEDPTREGLLETPSRVVKSWSELFSGYQVKNPGDILKTFIDGACDELVILKNIAFTSFCEHHILPFTGVACLAYLPDRRVVGVSKLVRLLEVFTRRLQIQERIGQQVVGVLMEELKPKGAACIIQAQHECMSCRGVNKSGCVMVTSALRGAFLENASARAELMQMCGI